MRPWRRAVRSGVLILVLVLGVTESGFARQSVYYPVEIGGRWGYMDEQGRLQIEPLFDAAQTFSNGLGAVRADGSWGFIDTSGTFVVPAEYAEVRPYEGGVARVRDEAGWWLVNHENQRLTQHPYAAIHAMVEDRAAFQAGSDPGQSGKPGKWGILDASGAERMPATFEGALGHHDGRLPVEVIRKFLFFRIATHWGFADSDGQIVIPAQYSSVRVFSEEWALVSTSGKASFIDADGKTMLESDFPVVHSFYGGRSRVSDGTGYGFIDRTGKIVIPLQYEMAGDFSQGRATVRKAGKWGYIDEAGEEVIQPVFERAGAFDGPLAPVQIGTRSTWIDRTGREITPTG